MRKMTLALVAAVAPLLLFEGGLRLFWHGDPARMLEDLMTDKVQFLLRESDVPGLEYELTPGAHGFAWGADVRVNSLGLRGAEVAADKGSLRRIGVLGDSVAFGMQVAEADAFPYQLECALNADGERYQVLNFAVGGYDIAQEIAVLEHKALALDLDLIVLSYCLNDVGVVSTNGVCIELARAQQSSPLFHLSTYRFITNRLNRAHLASDVAHANLPEVFLEHYAGQIEDIGGDEVELRGLMAAAPADSVIEWYRDDYRVGRLRYCFRRLATLAGGIDVVVLISPFLTWENGDYPYRMVHQIVAREAGRAGLTVLDPLARFTVHPIEELRSQPGDRCHPNALGHRLLMEALRDQIE